MKNKYLLLHIVKCILKEGDNSLKVIKIKTESQMKCTNVINN